ncbi:hypothetical protein [Enterococcus asini]|uniref:hypothetical protein n=1 Tax=Enterococcus asini TaxID=57732 RepID=UPI0022E80692|nr:hypothetical protein [Enterococcus asini]
MINVEINGKLVGQCESAGKASSPLFKDVIDPWIEIRGFTASSPSLTDNQQVVLEWLKQYREEQGENPLNTVFTIIEMYSVDPSYDGAVPLPTKVKEAYKNLNDEQEYQVLAAFAEWGMAND